jgi:hypothetical protein
VEKSKVGNREMTEKEPPSCFGEFVCMDDCMCSCPFWEECMFESEEREDEENE